MKNIDWQKKAEEFAAERHGARTDEIRLAMIEGANIALTWANEITGASRERVRARIETNVRADSGETKTIAGLNGD